MLSSEGFNHALVENQLLSLQQDISMDTKVTGRKVYKVKRDKNRLQVNNLFSPLSYQS